MFQFLQLLSNKLFISFGGRQSFVMESVFCFKVSNFKAFTVKFIALFKENGLNILPNLEEKTAKKLEKTKEYPFLFSHFDTTEIILVDKKKDNSIE